MLSKEAEQFIIELRMYLLSKGKNENEINELTAELEDHLMQAEAEGKNIKDITGDSPREYMKSIGQEMTFDVRQSLTLVPMTALLVLAFLCFTPAMWEDFTLSKVSMWGISIGTVLTLALYGVLMVRVLPRFFYSKWFYIITIPAYVLATGFFFIVELIDKDPFFVASPMQNNLIVAACIIIFIIWAFYAKTWITIIVPFLMSLGPLAKRVIPPHINEDPFFIKLTVIIIVFITLIAMGIIYYIHRKQTKKEVN